MTQTTDYEIDRLTETVASLGLTVRELVDRLDWVRALVTRWNQESGDEDGYTGGFAAASHLCAEELLAVLEPPTTDASEPQDNQP